MTRRTRKARLLGAALTVLLSVGLAGFSGLVLCIGADGHRALEVEHAGIAHPTANGIGGGVQASLQQPSPADCLDLPATGSSPVVPSPLDADRLPLPPPAILAALPEPTPRSETRLSADADSRAGPCSLAPHLASTVLLV
jgi:hypothetical protein